MVINFTYDKQEIPVSVGYYALKRFKGETGKNFENTEDDDLDALEVILWYSIEAGYKKEKKENPFKREDVELILDAIMFEFVARIPDFFPQTSPPTPTPTRAEKRKTGQKKTSTSKAPQKKKTTSKPPAK